jgi:hypothetical protein
LGTYEVKPTLARLKATLLGTGGALLLLGAILFGLIQSSADVDGIYGEPALNDLRSEAGELFSICLRSWSVFSETFRPIRGIDMGRMGRSHNPVMIGLHTNEL